MRRALLVAVSVVTTAVVLVIGYVALNLYSARRTADHNAAAARTEMASHAQTYASAVEAALGKGPVSGDDLRTLLPKGVGPDVTGAGIHGKQVVVTFLMSVRYTDSGSIAPGIVSACYQDAVEADDGGLPVGKLTEISCKLLDPVPDPGATFSLPTG